MIYFSWILILTWFYLYTLEMVFFIFIPCDSPIVSIHSSHIAIRHTHRLVTYLRENNRCTLCWPVLLSVCNRNGWVVPMTLCLLRCRYSISYLPLLFTTLLLFCTGKHRENMTDPNCPLLNVVSDLTFCLIIRRVRQW